MMRRLIGWVAVGLPWCGGALVLEAGGPASVDGGVFSFGDAGFHGSVPGTGATIRSVASS